MHQTLQRSLGASTAAAQLTPVRADGTLHVGDTILLRHTASEATLAALLPPLGATPAPGDDLTATASPSGGATARTALRITPAPSSRSDSLDFPPPADGEPIVYGAPVRVCIRLPSGGRAYLCSEKLSLSVPAARFSGKQRVFFRCVADDDETESGEYSEGEAAAGSRMSTPGSRGSAAAQRVREAKREAAAAATASLARNAGWTFVHGDQHLRFEHEGQAVTANRPLMLQHVSTGLALAVLVEHTVHSEFGGEHEVAAHTYYTPHKHEGPENMLLVEMGVRDGEAAAE